MQRRDQRKIAQKALKNAPHTHSLYENIRLNKTLPNYVGRLRETHDGVNQLLKAINSGDSTAPIFSQPRCYVYLLYLLENKKITNSVFLTVYLYLSALMQYTDRQLIKPEDMDVKLLRKIIVDKLVSNNELTEDALIYVENLKTRMKQVGYIINEDPLKTYILSLPPTEQWLLRVTTIVNLPKEKYLKHQKTKLISPENALLFSYHDLPWLTLTELGHNQEKVKKKNTEIWIPSTSIFQYILGIVSDHPIKVLPMFGQVGFEKIRQMHTDGEHPIALYAYHVKSNTSVYDRTRAAPFVTAMHDYFHIFVASLFTENERNTIFQVILPFLDQVNKAIDFNLDYAIALAADFNFSIYQAATQKDLLESYLIRVKKISETEDPYEGMSHQDILTMHKLFQEAELTPLEAKYIKLLMPSEEQLSDALASVRTRKAKQFYGTLFHEKQSHKRKHDESDGEENEPPKKKIRQ